MKAAMTPDSLSREDGWVLVSAMMLLAVMLAVALATLSVSDTGQQRSREQRERESALNLVEGVLYSQGFTLSQAWPGNGAAAAGVPVSCDQASTAPLCPTPNTLAAANSANPAIANFTNTDSSADVSWTTRIRDNGGPIAGAYVGAQADAAQSGTNKQTGAAYTCAATCRWDANGDRQLWVAAHAVVRGRRRDVVALLKLEEVLEATSRASVTAGGINIANNGNKIMLYAQGSQIVVRCDVSSDGCNGSQAGQIQPPPVSAAAPPLMTAAQLARFKRRAITDGTYFAGCPGNELSGAVVWVESCSAGQLSNSVVTKPCNPAAPPSPGGGGTGLAQNCVNQQPAPGMLIWHCGRLSMSGSWTYVGIVYAVNNSDGTCPESAPALGNGNCTGNANSGHDVISMTGGAGIWGVLDIDGMGCLHAGSNGIQLQYNPNVFGAVASYGTVGLVQNTWRELPPS